MTDAASAPAIASTDPVAAKPWGMDMPTFLMLLHLSPIASCIIPVAGLLLPIIMWATNKDADPRIDAHGKVVLNWMFSALIYGAVCLALCLVFIGFVLLPVLALLSLAFCIIGAVKANSGILWKYPMSIPFFKLPAAV